MPVPNVRTDPPIRVRTLPHRCRLRPVGVVLEGRFAAGAVDSDEIRLKVDVDTVAVGDLFQFFREQRHRKHRRRMREELQRAVLQHALATQMMGGEISDLLRRARALERQRRLGKERDSPGFEVAQAFPGVIDIVRRVIAADTVFAERVFQPLDLVPVELQPRADDEIVIGSFLQRRFGSTVRLSV